MGSFACEEAGLAGWGRTRVNTYYSRMSGVPGRVLDSNNNGKLIWEGWTVNIRIRKHPRSGRDRRDWRLMPAPPFVDGDGVVVVQDRRRLAERRLSGIRANWGISQF